MLLKEDQKLFNSSRNDLGQPNLSLAGLSPARMSQEFADMRGLAIANAHTGSLPAIPFPEKHPYPLLYPFNPAYDISIVGTFPPISYLLDDPTITATVLTPLRGKVINAPQIPFYHGNMNSLWYLLRVPLNNGNRLANRTAIINWLEQNRVNYFDIVSECQRKPKRSDGEWVDYSTDDDVLRNILPNKDAFNEWYNNVRENSLLIFNTSSAYGKNGLSFTRNNFQPLVKSFDIFLHVASQDYSVSLSIDGMVWHRLNLNQNEISEIWRNKVIFYLKIDNKTSVVVNGPSPSGQAYRRGKAHACFLRYQDIAPMGYVNTSFDDFRRYIYDMALVRNYASLFALNI